jgi:hypothetical protein
MSFQQFEIEKKEIIQKYNDAKKYLLDFEIRCQDLETRMKLAGAKIATSSQIKKELKMELLKILK